jgi:hypothetical protein
MFELKKEMGMIVDVIESMMDGSDEYPRAFRAARTFWSEFFDEHADDGDAALSAAIDAAQMPFQWLMEKEAGLSPPLAKSIMALTAIGHLYQDGFEDSGDLARRVIAGFAGSSTLSGGVKSAAVDVADLYDLG